MAAVNISSKPAGGVVQPGNSNLLLAQAGAVSPAAKRVAGARSVELKLGGHPVTAVPLGPPDSKGQTLYEVSWRGVTVQTALTGQIGAGQFKPGSPLKRQLEQAFRASQGDTQASPAGARTVEFRLGGHPVTAVPLGPPDSKGQTTYAVSWRGVTVQAPLTGQLSATQFKPGSWLKGALERAYEARQGPACPVSEAPVLGSNGRPAHVRREGLSASFSDGAGSTTTVRLPLYKDDNGNLGGYFTMVGGKRVALQGWSPAAAQSNGREVIESLRAQGRIDPDNMSTRRTHEWVMGGDGGQHWVPLARQSASDGRDAFWAYTAAGIPTDAVPKGGTPAFARGWNEARRGRGLLAGMAAVNATLGVLGAGAGAARGLRPSTRGAGPAGGPNMAWGARTQEAPSGRIEVSNGGRLLPPVRTGPGQPAGPGRPAAAPPAAAANRPLPQAGGGKGDGVIDVRAVTVSTQPVPRSPVRAKPLPSAEMRRQPEAPPQRNQAVVRQAAEWPEASPTPRPGRQGSAGRTQPPALTQAPRALPAAHGRASGPPALPQTARPAPSGATPGLNAAGGATHTTPLTAQAAGNGIAPGRWVVQQQPVQQPNQGPVKSQEPLEYSRLGTAAVVAPMQDATRESKALGSLLIGKLNGQVPLVAVGDRYLPALIGDMPSNGNNRTVYSQSLAPYQNVNTVFYTRPTDITNAQSLNSFVQFAYQAPAGSTVVIPTNNGQTVASLGQLLRPDVNWMGASDNAFINSSSTRSDQQAALSAVRAVAQPGNASNASSTNVARPLNADDAQWMSGVAGVTVPPGLVVSAPFDAQGNVNRVAFQRQHAQNPDAANAAIHQLTSERENGITQLRALATGSNAELTEQRFDLALSNPAQSGRVFNIETTELSTQRRLPPTPSAQVSYAPLGNVAVIGGTGNIGTAITAQMGGEVPGLISVSRSSNQAQLPPGATWAANLRDHPDVNTVFITASADWKRDAQGNIIFDRSALLSDNVDILLPQLGSIPRGSTVISVMNPSNTMAWVIHTLRPDLKVYGHEGTDLGRLLARTPNAQGEQGILFGPHSPNLVAVDRHSDHQPVVPVVGQIYSQMSGQSATLTTASSAVSEALSIRSGRSGSYAAPLNQADAAWLTQMMRTQVTGWTQEIPKGLVVAAPMNPQTGALDRAAIERMLQRFSQDEREGKTYTALRPTPGSTEFKREQVRPTELLAGAMNELLTERNLAIQVIQQSLAKSHPELRDVPIETLMRDPARLLELLAR